MEFQVELPMLLYIDDSGAVDMDKNCSAGGRIRHMKTNMSSLQNLKEAGILEILWLRWENNPVDMST